MADEAGGGAGGNHVVKRGESVASIAFEAGHYWGTVWAHPNNAALRATRADPNILAEGDSLHLPPLRPRWRSAAVDRAHVYRRRGVPSVLRLRVLQTEPPPLGLVGGETEGSPTAQVGWADVAYRIEVDGAASEGRTDADGVLVVPIRPNAKKGVLVLAPGTPLERKLELFLGHMDPIDTDRGVRERLRNLGLLGAPAEDSDERTAQALAAFQAARGLDATGGADDETRRALVAAHGS